MTVLRGFEGQDRREAGTLRILNLEDNPLDAELVQAHLTEGGISCELVRVQTRTDFAAALKEGGFDLILADYAVPNFDGLSALEMVRKICPEVPFILISGALGEEVAIETLKRGATDYVLKQRLERLVPAVRRAIHEAEERSERERAEEALRRSEQQFRTLVEQIPAATYTQQIAEPGSSKANPTLYASPQIEVQSGYPPQAFVEDSELWIKLLHPEDRERVLAEDRRTDETGEPFRIEYRQIARDGRVIWIRDEAVLVRDEEGRPRFWQGVMFDITERKQMEEALRESEERFRALVQYGSDIVTVVEADGTVRYQSPSIERVLGYRPEELVGANAFDNIHPEDIEQALSTFAEVLNEHGTIVRAEFRSQHADGSWRYIEGIGNNLLDDPSVRGIIVASRDVTERKEAEEKLREAERRYRTLIEQIPAITYVQEPGEPSRTTYISPQFETVLGHSPQECLSDPEHWIKIMHPADRERVLAEDGRTNETGEPFSMEYRQIAKDGRVVWIRDEATLVRDEEGSPSYWLGIQTDITEPKLAEERLQEAEARYRSLVEEVPAVIYIQEIEHEGAISYISPQIEDIMGYSPQEYIDDPNLWVRTTHPEDRERVLAEDRRTDESGEPFRMEFRKITREGRVIWVRDEAVLVKTPEGRPLYWQGVFADVTERKRTERALWESEHRFRQLFEQSVDALFVHDEEGRLVDCSAQACRSLGYTREELLKLSVKDFATNLLSEEEKKAKRGDTLWERAVRGEPGKTVGFDENELRRKDGTTFPVEVGVSAIDYGGRRLIFASARDMTERKWAEEELRRSEERFRATFEQATVGMAQVGLDGRWLRVNEKLCEIVGYRRDELLRKTFQDITHPDDLDADLGYTRQLLAGEIGTFSMEKRYFRKDGSIVWVNLTVSLVRGPTRDPKYFIAVIEDITARKRAEEALKQSEQLYRNVIEQAAENIFIVDVQTKQILEANAASHRSLGYAADEFKEMTLYDVVAHDRESIDKNIWRILQHKRYSLGEKKYRRKDGSLVTVEVNVSTVPYGGKEAMCVVAHDVSERKQAEQELHRSLSILLALREAGEVLGSTLESEEIITRLLEIMRGVAGLTAVIISRSDEEGDLHVWRSVGLETLRPRIRFAPEAVSRRRAALEHQEQRVLSLRGSESADEESLAVLYLPLKVKDRVVGVLEAYGSELLAQRDTMEVLSSLTSQAASALENAQLYEELGDRERALQDLVGKLLGAQEEERRRVAYEVHDGLAQVASAAHQHLQAFARRHSPDAERGRRDLERILRLVRGTVSDARRIIANLRPTALDDLGLAATLSLEIERLREEGYQVEYEEDLGEERLPNAVEIALFRVAQEALTNVRKHAQARRVRIELRRRGGEAHLEIQDYGRGFDPSAASLESGPGERVGLAGMRERVGVLGGELEVRSQPGVGTYITAIIPSWRRLP